MNVRKEIHCYKFCPNCGTRIEYTKIQPSPELIKYINNELKGYIDPPRKNVKRGELIGFSRKKMMAAILLAKTTLTATDIGKFVGTSASVVRAWNMEDLFRQTVAKYKKQES